MPFNRIRYEKEFVPFLSEVSKLKDGNWAKNVFDPTMKGYESEKQHKWRVDGCIAFFMV